MEIEYLRELGQVEEVDDTEFYILFSCVAKFYGVSLNAQKEPGPKLQNKVFDVILRFRRYPVVVSGDIYTNHFLRLLVNPSKLTRYFRTTC